MHDTGKYYITLHSMHDTGKYYITLYSMHGTGKYYITLYSVPNTGKYIKRTENYIDRNVETLSEDLNLVPGFIAEEEK